MNLHEIEDIYAAIGETFLIASTLLKIKLGLFKIKLEPYKNLIDTLKKECVTEESTFFEEKRLEIIKSNSNNKESEMNVLINDFPLQYNSYMEVLRKIEIIYSYECDEIPKLSLTIEEVPDDIELLSQKTQEVLFEMIEE